MHRCLIIDDEQHAIDLLAEYALQSGLFHIAGTSTDPVEGLRKLNDLHPDVVFLDIQMPRLSGMDFIKACYGKTQIILCTAYTEFVSEAYELDVLDYLLKPVRFSRFMRAASRLDAEQKVNRFISREQDDFETDYLFVKTEAKGKLLKINIRDIEWVEGMGNYIAIHHAHGKTMALLNMKDMEDRLPARHFIRVHKSFIVSLPKITGISGNIIHLKNSDAVITLGNIYKEKFMEIMKDKLMGK